MKNGYRIATGLFCAFMLVSAARYLGAAPSMVQKFHHLGYPDYLRQMLGVAKLLGVAALFVPPAIPVAAWRATLREWAYAGFAFDLIGAVISHFASSDGALSLGPAILLIPLFVSYRLGKRLEAPAPSSPGPIGLLVEPSRAGH